MTYHYFYVPSQKFPVTKITIQSKSHSLNFNVLSSVIDSFGEEVQVYHLILIIISVSKHGLSAKSTDFCPDILMKDLCVTKIRQKT